MRRFLLKYLVILLVLGFFLPRDLMSKRWPQGAEVIVLKTSAMKVKGELLRVNENSLVVMDEQSSTGVTISIDDVRSIRVIKKSKFWEGFLLGYVLVAPHAYSGAHYFLEDEGGSSIGGTLFLGTIWSVILAGGPALVGGLAGAAAGTDRIITIKGKSKLQLAGILSELDSLARFTSAPPLSTGRKDINITGAVGLNGWEVHGLSIDIGVERQLSRHVYGQFLFDYYLAPKVSDYSTIDESSAYGFNLNIVYKLLRFKKLNFFITGGLHSTTTHYTATSSYMQETFSRRYHVIGIGTGIGVESNLRNGLSLRVGITGKSAFKEREQYWIKCYAGLSFRLN